MIPLVVDLLYAASTGLIFGRTVAAYRMGPAKRAAARETFLPSGPAGPNRGSGPRPGRGARIVGPSPTVRPRDQGERSSLARARRLVAQPIGVRMHDPGEGNPWCRIVRWVPAGIGSRR